MSGALWGAVLVSLLLMGREAAAEARGRWRFLASRPWLRAGYAWFGLGVAWVAATLAACAWLVLRERVAPWLAGWM